MTLQEIADAVGFSSPGHVWSLKVGRQKTLEYGLGCRLIDLHRKVKRATSRRELRAVGLQR